VFIFCAPELIFDCFGGVGSSFHVLSTRNYFRRNRGRRVPFSCFTLLDSFSAVPRASGQVFMFCAPELVFEDRGGVGSRFHILLSLTHFRWYRGPRVPFLCFPLLDSFSVVPRASGLVSIFCGSEGVGCSFHVLRSRTHFRRFRGRRVHLSCFALPESFLAVPRASGPVFMFGAP
jgi:hypothetical protein